MNVPATFAERDRLQRWIAGIGLDPDLADDLDVMHRMRNGFVHASNTVHANEAARAIAPARRLLDIIAERSVPGVPLPSGHGVASAVAAIVDVEAVGMWLRHAADTPVEAPDG